VRVQKFVDFLDYVRMGLAGLPSTEWARQVKRVGCAAFETNVRSDLATLGEGNVFHEQADQALAFSNGGGGVVTGLCQPERTRTIPSTA
jgi:hypothetical protein